MELEFTKDAIDEIAEIAIKRKTGARGLRAIVEQLLMDVMFEIPSVKGNKKLVITGEMVKKGVIKDAENLLTDQKTA